MILEKIQDTVYSSVILENRSFIITDIDTIFRETNKFFANILRNMYIDVTFDFSKKMNKVIYTHAFIHTICEFIKNNKNNMKQCFYSNNLTKDPFRLKLLKKIKSIFGFRIYENVLDFTDMVEKLEKDDVKIVSEIETFLAKDHKKKTFKHIKKYLENTGLKEMRSNYFEDVANKMMILG